MNNIKNKGAKILILLLLGCLIVSCNSMDHDLEFNQLNDEIAYLKNVDDSISNEITNELLILETELMAEITKVEEFISDKLDKKVKEIDNKIKDQANLLNDIISDHSNQIGLQITNWDDEIGQLITTKSDELEAARKVMQTAHETAIAENDIALQNRIQAGEQHLNSFENMLPHLAETTSKRIDEVITMQERYNSLIDSLTSLETQRDLLESKIAVFKSNMESIIYNKLQEHATSGELNGFVEEISDIYNEAVGIGEEMETIYSDIEDIADNLPDVDSWISDLDQYFSEIETALDILSDFEGLDLDEILSKCDEVITNADEMSDRIDRAGDTVLESAVLLNDQIQITLTAIADRIGQIEQTASDIDDISADVDALISEF